jgi:hypothetical protein
VVLYVARNPLEAGLVADGSALEDFPWSGLGGLLGRRPSHPFEAVAETLALFDADPRRARERVRDRLRAQAGVERAAEPTAHARPVHHARLPFDRLLAEVSALHSLSPDDLRSRARTSPIAAARSELALRAAAELGLSGAEIGRRLGLSPATVSGLLARGRSPHF